MKNYHTFTKSFFDYLKYLKAEFIIYNNYLNALIIGTAVNILTDSGLPGKYAPYIIPVIVQAISKSAIKYKNRHMERLLQLPSEREDPVFIMNEAGDIILSTGLTLKNFEKNKITNIKQIIGDDGYFYLSYSFYDDTKGNIQTRQIELFSELYNKWYEIKIKYILSAFKQDKEFLIWFTDITDLKNQEERMSNMLKFSDDIISSLQIIIEKYVIEEIYSIAADSLLKNEYKCVFIGQIIEKEETIKGLAFKHEDSVILKSNVMEISGDIKFPPYLSGKITLNYRNIHNYSLREEFEKDVPFSIHENIVPFLNFEIENYIYYQSDNIFVIAFNKTGEIAENDIKLFEILAKNINASAYLQNYISSYFLHYLHALNRESYSSPSEADAS